MEVTQKIKVSEDFTDTPGARYKTDGPFSGEEFLENLLEPKFLNANRNNKKILVDMDGAWGYASSFISGSFGKLAEKHGSEKVLKCLEIKSEERPLLKDKIIREIKKY